MIGKGKTLLVHDDCMVSRVAHRLEELCGEIELCQSILKNAPDLPAEYRRAGGISMICWRTSRMASLRES